ncbi:MAG: hypothetical protein ACM3O9_09770 [Methylocystaceae bacterium]
MKNSSKVGIMVLSLIAMIFLIPWPVMAATSSTGINLASILSQKVLTTLLSVLTLILVDTLLGILASIKVGKFNLRKLPQFLSRNVLPYVGGLLVLGLTAGLSTELAACFYTAAGATGAKFILEVKDKVVVIFGSIEYPNNLGE